VLEGQAVLMAILCPTKSWGGGQRACFRLVLVHVETEGRAVVVEDRDLAAYDGAPLTPSWLIDALSSAYATR